MKARERKRLPYKTRRAIYDRDGGVCQKCDAEVLFHARYLGHPWTAEIDHIHPISKGGCDKHSNLQLLCILCNRRKGVSV